jgi:hypothetical protein
MVFPIVALPDPRGPWRDRQFWIYIISESFHVNLTYSGSVVLEKKIFKWRHPIFAFLRLSPLWRGPGPLFEQSTIPFIQGWFVPSLIEIGLLILEKIFKNFQCIFTLLWLSPFGEGQSPSLKNLESPPHKDDLCQVCLKLVQWFWRRSRNCKSLQTDGRTDGQKDDGQRAIRKAHWSFQLRWAKNTNMKFLSLTIQKIWPMLKFL